MTKKTRTETTSASSPLEDFIFFGGRLEREAFPMVEENTNPFEQSVFPLAQAKMGNRLCIVGFRGDAYTLQHLNHLGFHPGAAVLVVNRSLSGSVIVRVAGKRLGLGRQMAQQVMVCRG